MDGTLVDERILSLLDSGLYPAQIARNMGIRRNKVSRAIQRLEKSGLIEQVSEWPKLYRVLSNTGNKVPSKFQCSNKSLTGDENTKASFSMHNIGIRYDILSAPSTFTLDKEVNLNNWAKEYTKLPAVTIEKTTKSVIIYPKIERKSNSYDLLSEALNLANVYAQKLENSFLGLKLSFGKINRKPHFVLEDPKFNFGKFDQFTIQGQDCHMDDSDQEGTELEFETPEAAMDFARMPLYLKAILAYLEKLDLNSKASSYTCAFCSNKATTIMYGFTACDAHRSKIEAYGEGLHAQMDFLNSRLGRDFSDL
ncbi:MAG: winged helix-turn-helix domain-containing protein [Candidatus Methanofastidiosum sp.]|nr:winged helix-turn-helix domain-containing protein [Methanofastidiosum sp.]